MNNRENYLAAIKHQPHEWTPNMLDVATAGFGAGPGPWFEKGPAEGGYDGFGVRWVHPASGGGAAIPAPGEFVLHDITKWKETIKFPDIEAFDWAADAEEFYKIADPEDVVIEYGLGNGPFERLAALMGFEEALLAMAEEPEATFELLNAITDWKIKCIEKIAKYFKPDSIINFEDICNERSTFMSPQTYRELLKPCHARITKACVDHGIIPIQHTCGKFDSLIEDFIEIGVQAIVPVQPTNDIVGILEKYDDRITIIGGYNSNGEPGRTDDPEIMKAEVRRCIDTYGKFKSYSFFGFKLVNSLDFDDFLRATMPIAEEASAYARKVAGIVD